MVMQAARTDRTGAGRDCLLASHCGAFIQVISDRPRHKDWACRNVQGGHQDQYCQRAHVPLREDNDEKLPVQKAGVKGGRLRP